MGSPPIQAKYTIASKINIPGKNFIFGLNYFITLIFIMRLLQLLRFHYPLSFPGVCANFTFEIKLVNFDLYKNFSWVHVSTLPPGHPTDITKATASTAGLPKTLDYKKINHSLLLKLCFM